MKWVAVAINNQNGQVSSLTAEDRNGAVNAAIRLKRENSTDEDITDGLVELSLEIGSMFTIAPHKGATVTIAISKLNETIHIHGEYTELEKLHWITPKDERAVQDMVKTLTLQHQQTKIRIDRNGNVIRGAIMCEAAKRMHRKTIRAEFA